jgi:ABC-type Fe3+ transport system substrate-binding protein
MRARIIIISLLVVVVALPFVLRGTRAGEGSLATGRDIDRVVIITPHNEAIRHEFATGFRAWYRERHGRDVRVDWRVIGGTSEINRFLRGEYLTRFRFHWERQLRRPWNSHVEQGFQTDRLPDGLREAEIALRREARAEFLSLRDPGQIGIGIDIFFGGGSFDFIGHANAGRLMDPGIVEKHPEWFTEEVFPLMHNGEPFRDAQNRWFGATISSFGIIYNRDSLRRLQVGDSVANWINLGNPLLLGQLALADPTKSGSINKGFEMILQQQMQQRYAELLASGLESREAEYRAIRDGWLNGMRLIQRLGGNARYWTDSSQKSPIDVAAGNSAAGMAIDFYGRMQVEITNQRSGRDRLGFVSPVGGTTYSVDPVALLRGAPNADVGRAFIEFVLSPEGQMLWNQRVGTPGGPVLYNLRRQPVRRDSYDTATEHLRTDPEVQPYSPANTFFYRSEWTGRIFNEIAFVIRVIALDCSPELRRAWRALIDADFPPEATALFEDLSRVDYDRVIEEIAPIISGRARDSRIRQVQLAKDLSNHFRQQYREVERLARQGR